MEYSNNGFESTGILDSSMHSTNEDNRHVEDNLNEMNTTYGEYVSNENLLNCFFNEHDLELKTDVFLFLIFRQGIDVVVHCMIVMQTMTTNWISKKVK